jgi:hypothetical protein
MDQKAIGTIEKHIRGTVLNCEVSDGQPVIESLVPHMRALANEICKHKKAWLDHGDIYSTFFLFVFKSLSKVTASGEKKPTTKLENVLGGETTQQLSNELLKYFVSIPRPYEVFIPLPKISESVKSVEISEELSIITHEDAEAEYGVLHSLMRGPSQLISKRQYLRYKLLGFCRSDLESQGIRAAFTNFKIAFQQGMAKRLFEVKQDLPEGLLSGRFGLSHHKLEKTHIICIDKGDGPPPQFGVELPLSASRLLASLEFAESNKAVQAAIEESRLESFLKAQFQQPALLMATTMPEANRVRAASEWCFNSNATESETLSFLQVCIGLEALLGDETDNEGLTKTLADRCAYLIGSSIRARALIRAKFSDLYKTRSKIVHGNAVSLGQNERGHLDFGRATLGSTPFLRTVGLRH